MRRQNLRLDWLAARGALSAHERVAITTIVLLLILSLAGMHIVEKENSSLRSEIQRRTIDQRASLTSLPITAEEAAKRSKASQLVAQHNELVAVLEQLGKVAPDGVVIESISLSPEGKTYRVELRTSELEAARRYVDKLSDEKLAREMWRVTSIEARRQSSEWLVIIETQ